MNFNQKLLLEYIQHIKGHKNSKGEPAPWVIKSHETGKILSSHKTKEEAKKHLQHMHIFKDSEKSLSELLIERWAQKCLESNPIYGYSFNCSEEDSGDYLQEIVHYDPMADNNYSIQEEYLEDGTIKILSEEEFNKMTGNFDISEICEFPIDFYAMNTKMDILFAYCSENDIHYFFEK